MPLRLCMRVCTRPVLNQSTSHAVPILAGTDTVRLHSFVPLYIALTSSKTSMAIKIFLLCMMLYPEAQQRAHEELDHVVGSERLPTYEDCTSLAYLQAAWKEASRWRPVAPLGTRSVI